MRKYIKNIFLEMIPVILGILIALFINNWKENSDNQKFINTIMANMRLEIKDNVKDLEAFLQINK